MKKILQSSKVRAILIITGGLVVVLAVFAFGTSIGYHRGLFASHYGENYFRNFYGSPVGKMTLTMHGVAGDVIDVSSATIAVESGDGDEQSVIVLPDTVIREEDNTILPQNVNVGDGITVIGEPTNQGQIEAKFIRIFPGSSSMPMPIFVPAMPMQMQLFVAPYGAAGAAGGASSGAGQP